MQNVSFKSIYAIPVNDKQSPLENNFNKLIKDAETIKDEKKPLYYATSDVYFVYVRNENDKKFEDYAARYGINYRKASISEIRRSDKQNIPAEKELSFLLQAIQMGAKHEISQNGKTLDITLYGTKGKEIFATYSVIKSPEKGIKLRKKTEFLEGKTDCIHEYGDNGKRSRTIMLYGDNSKLEFYYDENDKPKIKKQ